MKRCAVLTTLFTLVLVFALPYLGGAGPSLVSATTATASEVTAPNFASAPTVASPTAADPAVSAVRVYDAPIAAAQAATAAYLKSDTEHLAQKAVPIPVVVPPTPTSRSGRGTGSGVPATTAARRAAAAAAGVGCPSGGGGGGSAPGGSESGIGGTTSGDIQSFASSVNSIRIANCLQPIAAGNFRYDSCMEQRLYWMAEDPSTNPGNTWGHSGVQSLAPAADGQYYSDTVPAKGCDGNLAGGSGNSGAVVAQKWWDSAPHRASLYRPTVTGATSGVCIFFAMTHGGAGNESAGFTRAAARWGGC